jgi:hypothetical protein
MLTAGMSTTAVARDVNVNFSTINRLQHNFREFGITSNWPHNRRPCVTTLTQDSLRLLRTISVCNKAFLWGKNHLIGWAWLPNVWAFAFQGPPMAVPMASHVK